jgi:signal transduction histidine kinase/ActR/RegA family two-component response regulator
MALDEPALTPLAALARGTEESFPHDGLKRLFEAMRGLASAREVHAVIEIVRRCARTLVGADGMTFVLPDGDQVFYAEEDAIGPLWKGRRFPRGACISGWVMEHGTPVAIEDIYADPRIPADLYRPTFVKSLAMVPVPRERPIAAIGAYWAKIHKATAPELDMLQALADAAAAPLANADLYDGLFHAQERARDAEQRLAAALAQANAANKAQDEFLAMLGHELRNPLAPIVNAAHLLAHKADGRPSREVAIIERQSRHLTRLVDELLDVSRVTRGKIQLKRARLSVSDMVAKAVETTGPLFEKRKHALDVQVEPGLVIYADEARMVQVVANLLSNAAKYTPEGGRISVDGKRAGGELVLCVKDNGQGISNELFPRIFDPFVQGPRLPDRAQEGLGLGLTLVRTLAGLHGGTVSVTSAGSGQGSEFTVRLPLVGTDAPEERGYNDPTRQGAGARRILVVDDNRDAAEMLAAMLVLEGHEVTTAFHPAQALELAGTSPPEIAILDIGLPDMDGYSLARRLREELGSKCPRLIALTGYGQQSDKERCHEAGFDVHLAKPVDRATLLAVLAGVGTIEASTH